MQQLMANFLKNNSNSGNVNYSMLLNYFNQANPLNNLMNNSIANTNTCQEQLDLNKKNNALLNSANYNSNFLNLQKSYLK